MVKWVKYTKNIKQLLKYVKNDSNLFGGMILVSIINIDLNFNQFMTD